MRPSTPARPTRKNRQRAVPRSGRSKFPSLVLSTGMALLLPHLAKASLLYWDPLGGDSITLGGPGTWNTSSPSWTAVLNDPNPPYTAWTNIFPADENDPVVANDARFLGSGLNMPVTLGAPIAVHLIDFAVTNYSLTNGGNAANTLTFVGADAGIALQSGNLTLGMSILGFSGFRLTDSNPDTDGLTGTVVITNPANTYSGVTRITAGTLEISSLTNLGQASSIGIGGPEFDLSGFRNTEAYLTLDGGTLRYKGNGGTTNRRFTISARGGTIESSGTGAGLSFSETTAGVVFPTGDVGPRTLTLGGTNIQLNNIAAPIADADSTGSSPTSVVKTGSGTWVMGKDNIYTGSTSILGGKLIAPTISNGGAPSSLGRSGPDAKNLVIDGGTLIYNSQVNLPSLTDRSFTVGPAGATIESSGVQGLRFTNAPGTAAFSGPSPTLTLTGTANGNLMALQLSDPTTGYALVGTTSNTLASFSAGNPEVALQMVPITGVTSGDVLQALDYRAISGELYALGVGTGGAGRLYKVAIPGANDASVAATLVGTLGVNFTTGVGFDFNPMTGDLRVVTKASQQNLRVGANGVVLGTDSNLTYVGPTPVPGVAGIAFSNNVVGAGSTTLYGIDSTAKSLVTIDQGSSGLLTTVGLLAAGVNNPVPGDNVGFDIASNGLAYASMQEGSGNPYRLYNINLSTGAAGLIGDRLFDGLNAIRDITMVVQGQTSLVKAGPGTWTLDRAGTSLGNTYTGATVIKQGSLILTFQNADPVAVDLDVDIINRNSPLVMSGGTLTITGKTTPTTTPVTPTIHNFQNFNGLTLLPGAAAIQPTPGGNNSTIVTDLGALVSRATGATVAFGDTTSSNNIIRLTANNTAAGILGAWATVGGTDWATMRAGGTREIDPLAAYTDIPLGGSIVDGLSTNVRINGGTSGNITLGSTKTTVNTLNQSNTTATAVVDLSGGKTLRLGAIGGILVGTGKQGLTIGTAVSSGTLTAGGADNATGELILHSNSNNLLTINSTIADNGSGVVTLVNAGTGVTALNAPNTYTGGTLLASGTLRLGDNRALSTGKITVNGSGIAPIIASTNGIGREFNNDFDLNSDLQFVDATGTGGLVFRGTFNLTGGSRVLTVTQANGYVTLDGTITNGSLVKSGPGALALIDIALPNLKDITLSQGSLDLWSAAGLGNTTIFAVNGALSASGAFYAPVTSTISVTGNLTLGRPQVSDGIDLGGIIDLTNATPFEPRVISISGAQPQQVQRISGSIVGGGFAKGGTSELLMTSSTSTYRGGTLVAQGSLRLSPTATLGENASGNDVYVLPDNVPFNGFPATHASPSTIPNSFAVLRPGSLSNIGSKQIVYLNNLLDTATPFLGWGSVLETNAASVGFVDRFDFNSSSLPGGLGYIRLLNESGRPVGIAIDGIRSGVDSVGKVLQGAPNADVWLGATLSNGTYTGGTLTPSGTGAWHLGGGGGTLTITGTNVMTGSSSLVTGSFDQNNRGITGTVYLPNPQNFSGGLIVGAGTTLVTGNNLALGDTGAFSPAITMLGGTLNLRTSGYHFSTDTQYAGRNFDFQVSTTISSVANSTFNLDPLGGGQNAKIRVGAFHFENNTIANPTFVLNSTNNLSLQVAGAVTLPNTTNVATTAATTTFQVNSGFMYVDGVIGQQLNSPTSLGANLQKTGGGTLILSAANTYKGTTIVNGGTLVVTNPLATSQAAMRLTSGTLSLRTNTASTQAFNFSPLTAPNPSTLPFVMTGSSGIFVGPLSNSGGVASYAGTTVQVPFLNSTVTNAVTLTVSGMANYDLRIGDGTNGLALASALTLTNSSARVEINGGITGAFSLTKAGIGTLTLKGAHGAAGNGAVNTVITQGTIVASHDNGDLNKTVDAFGGGTLSFTGTSSGALLLAGDRTLARTLNLDSTGGTQALGGFGAGNSTFAGNVVMTTTAGNTGLTIQSETGSTVNFTGTLSGGVSGGAVTIGSLTGGVILPIAGTPALGRGTVVFDPVSGAGNTFSLPLSVQNGTLIGKAQATGGTSPFGVNNNITLSDATLRLDGRAAASTTATTGSLIITGDSQLILNDASSVGTTFSVGALKRGGVGSLVYVPQNNTGLETFNIAAGATPIKGILAPWIVRATPNGASRDGDFVKLTNVTNGNLAIADYTTGDLNQVTANSVFHVTGATSLSANRQVYALRTGSSLTLGNFTLSVGDTTITGANAFGGLILNDGASITGGTLDFGQAEGVVYVEDGQTSSIGSTIIGAVAAETRTGNASTTSAIITGMASTSRLYPGMAVSGSGVSGTIAEILSDSSIRLTATPTAAANGVTLTFTGGATSLNKIGAGTLVLNAANTYRGGTTVSRGTLRMGTVNALGRWTNNGTISATNVTLEGDGVLDLGTGNGGNGFDTEIGSLAGDYGAVVDLRSSRLTVGRANLTTVFSGQLLGSSSSVLQKVGTGTLTLDNTRADGYASTFSGSVMADQGTLILVIADDTNGSPFAVGNSLGNVPTLTLRGGTVSLRTSGDNNTTQQNMMGKYDVVVTGGTGTLAADRFGGTDQNKLIELGNLTVGKWQFATTAANNVGVKFNGTTRLLDNAYFNTGDVTLSGKVTDRLTDVSESAGYTLNKVGGNLFLESGLNDYSGGTVITGGNLFFGGRGIDVVRFPGFGNFVPNDTGRAGTGPIVVNPNSVINFTNVGNVAPGQTTRVLSSTFANGNTSAFVIQTDRSVADFNLRTLGRGSLQIGVQNGTYYTPLDMSKIGNGEWGLTTGRSVETLYMGSTLGAGAGNIYRFYGSSGAALVIMEQNAISGTGAVELGRSMLEVGGLPGNANASIRFTLGQDYTGSTLIHRSATAAGPSNALLDIRSTLASGTSASNPIEVYGRLFATGAGTFTNAAGNQVNTNILLRPGSELRLDYNNNAINNTNFLVPTGTTSATGFDNKWGDNQAITLDGATLRVSSGSGVLSTEIIGSVNYKGGAEIFPESVGTGGNAVVLINGTFNRTNLGTLAFRSTAGQLGLSGEPGTNAGQRIAFQNPANAVASGVYRGVVKSTGPANGTVIPMVSPRFYSNTANTFVDYAGVYNGDPFTPSNFQPTTVLGFSDVPFKAVNSVTFNGGGLNNGTEIIDQITSDATSISANTDIWALRTNVEIGSRSTYGVGSTITIRSGGLAVTDAGTVYTPLLFRNGTTAADNVEADIWTVSGTVNLRGQITAQNLVKTGAGTLQISADNTASAGLGLSGTLQINGGTLILGGANPNPTVGQPDLLFNAAQALGSVTNLRLHAGNFNNAGNQMPQVTFLSDTQANYNQSVTVSEYVPFATLNVDRISTTPGTPTLTIEGGLMIEGGGSDGTVLALTNGNGFDFVSKGTTTLGMDANHNSPISVNVVNTDNNAQFTGKVTGPAPLIKTGAGPLTLQYTTSNAQNDYSGGTTINAGTLQLRNNTGVGGTASTTNAGSGAILLNAGFLQLVSDTANSNLASAAGNSLTIAGQSVLTFDRLSGATNLVIGLGGDSATLTTKNSPVIQFNTATGNVSTGFWAGKTVINDSPTFNLAQVPFQLGNASPGDSITGSGHIYKTGANQLSFNSGVANTFSGGLDVLQGQVAALTASDTFGTGKVKVHPSGLLGIASTNNIVTNTLDTFRSTSTAPAGFVLRSAFTATALGNLNTILPSGSGGGLLELAAVPTTALDLSTFSDGTWFLGAASSLTYNQALPAGGGNTYRLGGGGATLTLSVSGGLVGASNKLIVGKPYALGGNGTVVLTSTTVASALNGGYGGGTTISRVRDSAGNVAAAQLTVQGGFLNVPLGSNTVDVYGTLQFEGASGTAASPNQGTNRNIYSFHPGARLIFQNGTANNTSYTGGSPDMRWGDSAGIALQSSDIELAANTDPANLTAPTNNETVGNVTFSGGSELRIARGGGGGYAQLSINGSLTREGGSRGTLTISHTSSALGLNDQLNLGAERITVAGGVPMNTGMVAPYFISRTESQFLRYDDNLGFQTVNNPTTGSPNYVATTGTTLTNANGTDILSYDNTGAATLGANLNVWALRTQGDINAPLTGPSSITIQSGGLTIYGGTSRTINADVIFGTAAAPAEALIHASSQNLTLNGRLTASAITKFGISSVTINQDQPGVTSLVPWNINEGVLIVQTPGGLGNGPVFLNGWAGINATQSQTELRLNFNSGSPDELTFTSGKITVRDINVIRAQLANDRTARIADIDLVTTNTVPQTGNAGFLRFQVDGSRTLLRTGTLKMTDDYVVQVDATSFGPGSTAGVSPDAINNQGTYNLTKIGDGLLTLGDNRNTFTGASRTFTVNEGGVKVTDDGSLGGINTNAIIDEGGALEIAKAGYTPTGNLTQKPGSIERWSVNGARSVGTYSLGQGVHLQIAANQTGNQTINVNGGSIMGYVPLDLEEVAINYSLGPNVSVNLQGDSMLGQPYPAGTNTTSGSANHFAYDMGKQNQPNNPADPRLNGALFDIRGRISGQTVGNNYTLTKVGLDQIQLSGNNNSGAGENVNLEIREGTIVLGSSNALPANKTLTLSGSGTLDLNGFNASTTTLKGSSPNATIANSATTLNSLTVTATSDQQYDGGLSGNLGLVVNNSPNVKLTLTGALATSGNITAQNGIVDLRAQATGTASFRINSAATLQVNNLSGGLQLKPGQVLAGGVGSSAGLVTGTATLPAVTAGPGSTISPGISTLSPLNDFGNVGKLEITAGDVALQAGAHLRLEIADLGLQKVDQLLVDNGNLALGSSTLDLIVPYASVLKDQIYYLAINGTPSKTTTGTFANLTQGSFFEVSGYQFQITYHADSTQPGLGGFNAVSGNDVALLVTVPEPGSLTALAAGLTTVLGLRRFRRRS